MRAEERALNHAPPRLSDLHGQARADALRDRHEANRARWLRIHEDAGRTMGQQIARGLRALKERFGA